MGLAESVGKQGFAVIPELLSPRDIDRLLRELSRADLPRSKAGVRHAMKLPAVSEFAGRAPLLEIATEILGKAAIPFRATVFDKSPTANWLVVWHQDTALPLVERREAPGWGLGL